MQTFSNNDNRQLEILPRQSEQETFITENSLSFSDEQTIPHDCNLLVESEIEIETSVNNEVNNNMIEEVNNSDKPIDIENCEIIIVDSNISEYRFQEEDNVVCTEHDLSSTGTVKVSNFNLSDSDLHSNFVNTDSNTVQSVKPKIIKTIIISPSKRISLISGNGANSALINDNGSSNLKNKPVLEELKEVPEILENDIDNEDHEGYEFDEDDEDDEDNLCDKDYLPMDDDQSDEESDDDDEVENLNEKSESTLNSTQESTINLSTFSSLYARPGKSGIPAAGLEVLSSKGKTGKSKVHFCYYCHTMQLSIARHLERLHADEPLVKKFMSLKKKSNERKKQISIIRKKGDFLHNTSNDHNKGFIITVRRSQVGREKAAEDIINCPKCYGFYTNNNIRHHYAMCSESSASNTRSILQNAARKIGRVHVDASYKMRHQILPFLRNNDEITNIIRYDRLIILYGNFLSIKHKKEQQDNLIRAQLRLLGRLVSALKGIDNKIEDLAEAFHPTMFNNVLEAVNVVAQFNERNQKYGSPSTASAIGTALRKCSKILKCEYIILTDREKKGFVEEFMEIFDTKFGVYINKNVAESQIDMQRKKIVVLPNMEDINSLMSYLIKERDYALRSLKNEFTVEVWKHLSEVVLIYLMVFNRRRRGEMQFLTVEDFENRVEINEFDDLYRNLPEKGKKHPQNISVCLYGEKRIDRSPC